MENTANSSVPDFKELNYTRPDLDKFTETVRNVRLRLMTAKTIEAADEALGEYEIAISSFDTQYALCQILHDLDTSNEYYNTEMEFFDDFYKKTADKYKTKYITTAHHGDDLIETILMRISRGSHLKGYAGFQKCYEEKGYVFIKPLIYCTKDDIKKYNEEQGIPTIHDYTNDLDVYTRNRYRHHILPFLFT